MYNDPKDYAPFGITPNVTYDQKWYMPPSGAQRGSTYILQGDPLTPVYPSTGNSSIIGTDRMTILQLFILYLFRLHVSSG